MSVTTRRLTCIVCPKGCELTVSIAENGNVEKIEGNTCKRGEEYGRAECTHPVRTVTSTVKTESGRTVAVKTSAPIPKELIFQIMAQINAVRIPDSEAVYVGKTIISKVCDTDADVIATSAIL